MKNWEVGSFWYLPKNHADRKPVEDSATSCLRQKGTVFLSTCRSAIGKATDQGGTNAGTVLLPAFTCETVIRPFIQRGYKVIGYPVRQDLSIDWNSLIDLARRHKPSHVLIHGYFGFPYGDNAIESVEVLKDIGVTVIEDQTQNLFSCIDRPYAHYRVGSIRKWFPIPDGAFMDSDFSTNSQAINLGNHSMEDSEVSKAKWEAMKMKSEYIFSGIGEKSAFMSLHSEAEHLLDSRIETFSISQRSWEYLETVSLKEMVEQRQKNYDILAKALSKKDFIKVIYPNCPQNVVPFMVPVLIGKGRAEFQKYMATQGVYPTVIWSCPDVLAPQIDQESKDIYNQILCFHCDQRYGSEDMEKVATLIDKY